MDNKTIAAVFKLVGQLMEVHGENKFKARSYSNAAFQIGRFPVPVQSLPPDEYESIPGIGKNLVPKLRELLETGEMGYLRQWLDQTPEGVVEMLKVKGLGPSKVRTIWRELEIESLGELLYACNENRLVELKGFGASTQEQVKASIEYLMESSGKFLYASLEALISDIKARILSEFPKALISETGAMLRRDPVVKKVEFVVSDDVESFPETEALHIPVEFYRVQGDRFDEEVFLRSLQDDDVAKAETFRNVVPEMRNVPWALEWAGKYQAEELITDKDLRGSLHNHSTYSDGLNTLEDMARHLMDTGLEYFGICDHSQTASYAGGMSIDSVLRQHKEIERLNKQLAPFCIFKGIESDILMDGSLDYPEEILTTFDFIVASVHSVLNMNEDTATRRLIRAVENPHTTILGHPTGRLLLSRKGYPIDHKKVIDACAANGVVIELNANPMRLDIDYKWIPYCMEKGVMLSINPDAHRIEGFDHTRYGVMAARKGGLLRSMTLNAMTLDQITAFFAK